MNATEYVFGVVVTPAAPKHPHTGLYQCTSWHRKDAARVMLWSPAVDGVFQELGTNFYPSRPDMDALTTRLIRKRKSALDRLAAID